MKKGTSIRLAALLLAGFIQACGSGAVTPPPVNSLFSADVPLVQATTPGNLKKGVAYNSSLSVTFSEAVDPASVNTNTFTVMAEDGSPVTGTVSYSGRTAVFKPAAPLLPDTIYSATVTTGVHCKDTGNPLSTDYNWMFTTGVVPDTTPPQVTFTAFGVATFYGVYGGVVLATFSEPMDTATLNPDTFVIVGPGGAAFGGNIAFVGLSAVFAPTQPFAPNTTYTATVTAGAKDLAGNAMAQDYTWTFTTPDISVLTGQSTRVNITAPADLATGVLLGTSISVTFNQVMDPLSITHDTFMIIDADGRQLPGTVNYSGYTATFTPASPLSANTSYRGLVKAGATSLSGVPMDADYKWLFTTGEDVAGTPPIVQFTSPLPDDLNVQTNTSILVAFDEPMDPTTLNVATFTLSQPDGTLVDGMVSYTGTTAVFTPTSPLFAFTTYTARISTAVTDLGGTPLAADYVWTFSTGDTLAATIPQVVFTNPADNDVRVSLTTSIDIAFSEVMAPTTITTDNIVVTDQDGSVVPGTLTYMAYMVIFTPSAHLAPGVTYTVTVGSGVKDLEGLSLTAPYSISFTTLYAM